MADYTHVTAAGADDWMAEWPGFGEMLSFGRALGAEQIALTRRTMPPGTGGRGSYGHSHKTQEELLLVTRGRITVKVGDDVFEAATGDAVRFAPEAVRSVHNDSDEEAELVLCSTTLAGGMEDEVVKHDDFWPEG